MSKPLPLGIPKRNATRLSNIATEALDLADCIQESVQLSELARGYAASTTPQQVLAHAIVAARMTLELNPYPVQVLGALTLVEGILLEMNTGEGKTLTAALAAALWAHQAPTHVATANDYLASRDAAEMAPLYNALGLTVSSLRADLDRDKRRTAYESDIVYATAQTFGFDYLTDQLVASAAEVIGPSRRSSIIVDEADSLLIDEATTPLILAAPVTGIDVSSELLAEFAEFARDIDPGLIFLERDLNTAVPSAQGLAQAVAKFPQILEDPRIMSRLRAALIAEFLYRKGTEYLVVDPEAISPSGETFGQSVVLIDTHTGRITPDRRMQDGIHDALEAKERLAGEDVPTRPVDITRASITLPSFFSLYTKMGGMTGTARTDADELARTYGTPVAIIPPHCTPACDDRPDRIFSTQSDKFTALVLDVVARHATGQPVLIVSDTVQDSELVSELLHTQGVPHKLLNARRHAAEAEVIAPAGLPAAVTVATVMAGRGVDIRLGGNRNKSTTPREQQAVADHVRSLGGLAVLATTRFSSRRVDRQVRGRAGRQGDPGVTIAYVSLEDEIAQSFASKSANSALASLAPSLNSALAPGELTGTPSIQRLINKAQLRQESLAASQRREVMEYDLPAAAQRAAFYGFRRRLLTLSADEIVLTILHGSWKRSFASKELYISDKHMTRDEMVTALHGTFKGTLPDPDAFKSREEFVAALDKKVLTQMDDLFSVLDDPTRTERARVLLAFLLGEADLLWATHLEVLDTLRSDSSLASYSQSDARDIFAKQARIAFDEFSDRLFRAMSIKLLSLQLKPAEPAA